MTEHPIIDCVGKYLNQFFKIKPVTPIKYLSGNSKKMGKPYKTKKTKPKKK